MEITRIDQNNEQIHMNLAQVYEAEFSPLTHVLPDENGLFCHHTTRVQEGSFGYLLYCDGLPGGFGIFHMTEGRVLVEEFFVSPHLRRKGVAAAFLRLVGERHPGIWDVRQLESARHAYAFWTKWASRVDPDYTEEVLTDEKWGRVTRQLVRVGNQSVP